MKGTNIVEHTPTLKAALLVVEGKKQQGSGEIQGPLPNVLNEFLSEELQGKEWWREDAAAEKLQFFRFVTEKGGQVLTFIIVAANQVSDPRSLRFFAILSQVKALCDKGGVKEVTVLAFTPQEVAALQTEGIPGSEWQRVQEESVRKLLDEYCAQYQTQQRIISGQGKKKTHPLIAAAAADAAADQFFGK